MEPFPGVVGKILFSYFFPIFPAGIPWYHFLHFFCSGFTSALPLPSYMLVWECWGNCLLTRLHYFHLGTAVLAPSQGENLKCLSSVREDNLVRIAHKQQKLKSSGRKALEQISLQFVKARDAYL